MQLLLACLQPKIYLEKNEETLQKKLFFLASDNIKILILRIKKNKTIGLLMLIIFLIYTKSIRK